MALAATLVAPATGGAAPSTCQGREVTITAQRGRVTNGTAGPDVIMGTPGDDIINGRGGADVICARGGDDTVSGGRGADRIDLGGGNDTANGGPGHDVIRGRRGADTVDGGNGRDSLDGGKGRDTCDGQRGADAGHRCERVASLTERLDDTFAGNGDLIGYTTNNADALPGVQRRDGRYRAPLVDNTDNVTLHYHQDQGRLDAKMVEFPFDVVVRNIGIGNHDLSQVAPVPNGSPYVFAGVQVHVPDLDDPNSSHVVVGHRGGTHFTIEGKNTRDGHSSVNDIGANTAPDGRADIRIVGNADRTLTVYWQTPNPSPGVQADDWNLYNGTGTLPGQAPDYPNAVYIGLITYAFGSNGVPFVGTADAIEDNSGA